MQRKFIFSSAVAIVALMQVVQTEHNADIGGLKQLSSEICLQGTAKWFTYDLSSALYGAGIRGCFVDRKDSGVYIFVDGQYNYLQSDDFKFSTFNHLFITYNVEVRQGIPSVANGAVFPPQKIQNYFGHVMVGVGKANGFQFDSSSYSKRSRECKIRYSGIAIVGKLDISRLSSPDINVVMDQSDSRLMLRKSSAWAGSVGIIGTLGHLCRKVSIEVDVLVGVTLYGRDSLTIGYPYYAGYGILIEFKESAPLILKQNIGFTSYVDIMCVYRVSYNIAWAAFVRGACDYIGEEQRDAPSVSIELAYKDALTKNLVGNIGLAFMYVNN